MSEQQKTKEQLMLLAAEEMEQLLIIIGELGFTGYKVSMCRLQGKSLQQCANKYGLSKSAVQYIWEKCCSNGYDVKLSKLFQITYASV